MPSLTNIDLVFRSGWGWPTVLAVVCAAGLLCVLWNRPTRGAVSRGLYVVLTSLQVLAALLLALWMVNPRLRYEKSSAEEGGVAIVVDTSMSMSARDMHNRQSRYAEARRLLLSSESLGSDLRKKAKFHTFTFNSQFKETEIRKFPSRPDPAGLGTDLAGTLEALSEEIRARRLQGVVLATDGRNTGARDPRRFIRDLKAPVYVIGLGKKSNPSDPWKNAGLISVDVPTRVSVDQEIEIKAKLRQEGFDLADARISLLDGDETVDSANLTLRGAPLQTVSLKCTPTEKGTRNYRLVLTPPAGDKLDLDDSLEFSLLVSTQSIRVLYIEGRLRWVYKFLRRVLEREATIEADCVIRTGPGKLYHQGRSNLDLRNALPADLEGFSRYDAIILGDFPRALLPDAQLKLLEQFVREKKGGLLLVGGRQTLASGEFAGSLLESLLPAVLVGGQAAVPPTDSKAEIRPRLTARGKTNSILAGLDKFMPGVALRRVFDVQRVKPGSEILLEARRGNRDLPVLVAQRYGEGRILLLTTEDFWKASLSESGKLEKSPTARFWIQAIQWLAQREEESDEEDPLIAGITDKAHYDPGETVTLAAFLRKPGKENEWGWAEARVAVEEPPLDEASASGNSAASATRILATLKFPKPDSRGRMELTWTPPHDGRFKILLQGNQEGGRDEVVCHFTVGRPFREFDRQGLDEDLLREIARETGGGYYAPLNARDIAEAFERNPLVTNRTVETDLVDSPYLLALFCAIVCAGWILRRRKNLI